MFKIENISYSYIKGKYVLKDISFELKRNDFLSIIGPNGSGKTTLLKSLSNILVPEGNVSLNGKQIKSLPRKEISKKISYFSQLKGNISDMSIYDTVSLGRYPYLKGILSKLTINDEEIIKQALEKTNLYHLKDNLTSQLSGGQLQRVFLAQIIVQDTDIILLDEPTNHLDLKVQVELLDYIKKYAIEHNKIIVGVFHDLNTARKYSNKILLLDDGKQVLLTDNKEMFEQDVINDVYGMHIKNHMIDNYKEWVIWEG